MPTMFAIMVLHQNVSLLDAHSLANRFHSIARNPQSIRNLGIALAFKPQPLDFVSIALRHFLLHQKRSAPKDAPIYRYVVGFYFIPEIKCSAVPVISAEISTCAAVKTSIAEADSFAVVFS